MGRVVIPGFRKIEVSGCGEGGTTNYNDLTNKPSINNVPLVGNLRTVDLKLTDATLTEEGVPAEAKTVGDKLAEQSTSLTALSEQLGNHTVKSDVPENAVFTDTVYNDKDIKAEIAKKADTTSIPRKVSELTNDSNYQTGEQVNNTVVTEISKVVADAPEDLNTLQEMSDWIAGHENDASAMNSSISDNKAAITALQKGKADKSEIPTTLPADGGNADTVNNHTVETNVPADALFTDTVYDDTEVTGSIDELSSNLDDLAYGERIGNKNLLDVSKIKGMSGVVRYGDYGFINTLTDTRTDSAPFFNLYDGDTFVAGGKSLTKTPSSGIVKAYGTFTTTQPINRINIGHSGAVKNCSVLFNINLPAGTYTISMDIVKDNPSIVGGFEFKNIQIEEGDTATPYKPYIPSVKMLEDEVSAQNESLETLGKCKNLLNSTLQTTTINGITCTNNGDGTYTLNGTKTVETIWLQLGTVSLKANKSYKLIGQSPVETSADVSVYDNNGIYFVNGTQGGVTPIITPTTDLTLSMQIRIAERTLNNFTIKPMITTNLDATYDDFVPYTGNGDTLAADVAALKNDLDKLNSLPIGSIIQIEAAKDNIETTTQKYGWQYLGTSNIECGESESSAKLLVTNVYRKNN